MIRALVFAVVVLAGALLGVSTASCGVDRGRFARGCRAAGGMLSVYERGHLWCTYAD